MHNFGVDWKLLLAQGLNFFILLVVLRQFVYKPILKVLKKRREDIEKGIEFTKNAEENLKNADLIKDKTVKEAKEKAYSIINDAEKSANLRKDEIIAEAEAKKTQVIGEAKVIIEEHKNQMLEGVYSNAEGFLKSALEKVLGRMSASDRDNQLIKDALREVKSVKNRV